MSLFYRTVRGFTTHGRGLHIRPIQAPFTPHMKTIPGRRSFHLNTVGDAVIFTADSISFIHHAGVPWYLTIPLVALGVNFSFRLPIQYFTRRLVVTRNKLTPLVKAWSSRHAATVPVPAGGGEQAERVWRLRVSGLTERSRARIYKAWGVQRWKSLAPFASMVPFIVVSEALRRLCGAPLGWISHTLGLGNVEAVSSVIETSKRFLDPCLTDGGCLWFTDLTAMDPYYALPVLCSALLAKTSWGRLSKEQLRALLTISPSKLPQTPITRIQTAVGRTLLLIPLFPILFADLPSAIFLYWASTFAMNEVNEAILERILPKASATLTTAQKGRVVFPYLQGTTSGDPSK
ncbi:hypothetical protein PT974_02663 [Cladobotryum mycophilum]|uniref:Mitochondrial export translocase Oxa2 n=1 Tax=Cladobotryum mycophilum TaxID=491253 RepID=A0ABR0SYV6_9HYPO